MIDLFKKFYSKYFSDVDLEISFFDVSFNSLAKTVISFPSCFTYKQARISLKNFFSYDRRFRYIVLKSTVGRGCVLLFVYNFGRVICLNRRESTTHGLGVIPFIATYCKYTRDFSILPF